MLGAVTNVCQSYYDNIPINTLPTIGKSAVYSFFISFVFLPKTPGEPMNMARPIAAAGYAALVSLIHALTTPIFNGIFGDNEQKLWREFPKWMINQTIASSLVCYATASKVNYTAFVPILSLSMNYLTSGLEMPASILDWLQGCAEGGNFNPDDPGNPGAQIRYALKMLGLNAVPGVNSVYLAVNPI